MRSLGAELPHASARVEQHLVRPRDRSARGVRGQGVKRRPSARTAASRIADTKCKTLSASDPKTVRFIRQCGSSKGTRHNPALGITKPRLGQDANPLAGGRLGLREPGAQNKERLCQEKRSYVSS